MMSDIVLDTYKLNQYAQRISAVNSRIGSLDSRLNSLYLKVGLQGIFDLIQADVLTCYSWRLARCQSYLQQTALDFEKVEKELENEDPLSFSNANIHTTQENQFVFDNIISSYFSIFSEYVSDKVEKYIDEISSCENTAEAVVGWYKWFRSDLFADFDSLKSMLEDVVEEMTDRKPNLLPKSAEDFFDTLSECQIIIDVTSSLGDWHKTGDGWQAYQDIGLTFLKSIVKKGNKWLDEKNKLKYLGVDKQLQSVLIGTITKMPEKWIDSIKNYAANGEGTAGSIVIETVFGSLVEAGADAAKPYYVLGTAVTYPVVDQICQAVGYDLSGQYERLTGEKGLDAVFSAQKELWVDTIYEGAKDKAAEFLDGCYSVLDNGWNHWKSGIEKLFGGN